MTAESNQACPHKVGPRNPCQSAVSPLNPISISSLPTVFPNDIPTHAAGGLLYFGPCRNAVIGSVGRFTSPQRKVPKEDLRG